MPTYPSNMKVFAFAEVIIIILNELIVGWHSNISKYEIKNDQVKGVLGFRGPRAGNFGG